MKVDLEKIKLSSSPLTGEVFAGITNKTGEKWLHKVERTNEFYEVVLQKFLGAAKEKCTVISSGSSKWEITVKKIKD